MPERRTVKLACLLFITGGLLITTLVGKYVVPTARADGGTGTSLGPARTGAPAESTCALCHFISGTTPPLNSSKFTLTAPAAYVPGQTYQITVSHNDGAPFTAFGFQLTVVRDSTGDSVGTLQNLSSATTTQSDTVTDSSTGDSYFRTWINHSSKVVNASTFNASWTFNWTAPSTDVGSITFYAAGLQANNNGKEFDNTDQAYLRRLTIQATTPPPVANDNFVNAQTISGSTGSVSGSNVGATKETGEPDHAGDVGGASVWYRWQAPSSGDASFDTVGSDFDTLLAVYTGSSVGALTLVASNDQHPAGGNQSRVDFDAAAGTVYYIAVDGWSFFSSIGNITLNWSVSVPPAINSVTPRAGRVSGGQQITLTGSFADVSAVRFGGVSATINNISASQLVVTTPQHAAGAVAIELVQSSGNTYTKQNAFAYLPTVFTDNTLVAGVTVSKAQHVTELRQAAASLRAVAGLSAPVWTNPTLQQFGTQIKAVHIQELRTNLEQAVTALDGYPAAQYTDQPLSASTLVKRVHLEELRQRIRNIAG